MEKIDQAVARSLKDIHDRQFARLNEKLWGGTIFRPGDEVYYRRPEGSGNKLDSRWLGPVVVVAREGEHSYQIRIKENVTIKAHSTFLKPSLNKQFLGRPVPLFFHKRTVLDPEAGEDEWLVERILNHRYKNGCLEFFTHWKGYDVSTATWEPVKHFFHRYNSEVVKYCQYKNIPLNVAKLLPTTPPQTETQSAIRALGASQQGPPQAPFVPHIHQDDNSPRTWN